MDKRSKNRKIINGKDIFIIILAVCAVLLFVVFLIYVNEEQKKQNEQLQQLLQQDETEITYTSAEEQDICINEICKEGWVEIYNRNDSMLDISGVRIVCGEEELTIPDGKKIGGKGFLSVDLPVGDHVPVEVFGEDGTLYDSVFVPVLEEKESFARKEDGGIALGYFDSSKDGSNETAKKIPKDFIYFDVQSGFYNQDFRVQIMGPENWKIYYTLDGSKPGTKSELYERSIRISNRTVYENKYAALSGLSIRNGFTPWEKVEKCTILRAVAIDEAGNRSQEINASYFVANGNKSMYMNLPTISVSADPDALFGYEKGVYPSGKVYEDALASETFKSTSANYYMDYSAKVHVKYFGEDKQLIAEGDSILQTYKDGFLDYVQKSLLLSSEKESYILSAGGNDNALKIRDLYMQEVLEDTQAKAVGLQPCTVFLEGEYWGIYLLQKAVDEKMLEEQYGIPADNIVCAVGGKSTDPKKQKLYDEFYEYVVNTDLTDDAAYQNVEEMMDVQSYLDCYCAHIYIADSDWMNGNDVAWKTVSSDAQAPGDGKWRFVFWKAGSGMGSTQLSSSTINTYLRPAIWNDAFMYSLLQNQGFRQKYIATMEKYAEEMFSDRKVEKVISSLSEKYQKSIQASYSRFGSDDSEGVFKRGIETVKDFFQNRKEYIMKYSKEFIEEDRKLNDQQQGNDEEEDEEGTREQDNGEVAAGE